jgi:signal transduction histidine kinase
MDTSKEGILLIWTTMILLISFLIAVLAVMIIYRRRKIEHFREIEAMNERFSRELMQAQIEVQRETMSHIGREIHDNVGQKLVLAVLYTGQIHTGDEEVKGRVDAVTAIINESLHDLRGLSKSLTDPSLLRMDLFQLLSDECQKVRMAGGCSIHLDANTSQLPCSPAVKSFVLRIVQEFLQNSLKHAECSGIHIEISKDEKGLQISARDDGKGFDMHQVRAGGIGLVNMRNRAEMMGAGLCIKSAPGAGTSMVLFIPESKIN